MIFAGAIHYILSQAETTPAFFPKKKFENYTGPEITSEQLSTDDRFNNNHSFVKAERNEVNLRR